MDNRRNFQRTPFASRVKITHAQFGTAIFLTGDVSDGGVFLKQGEFELAIGDLVEVQIQGLPVEAPVVRMIVVRSDAVGYGLCFAG